MSYLIVPCATLVLKTSDLTAGSSTNIGIMNTNKTDMTWSNINLRLLLGDMYDKYDYFNLYLKDISTAAVGSTAGASLDDRNLLIRLGGLPFVNQTYSQSRNANQTDVILTPFNNTINVCNNLTIQNGKQFTFAKNQDVCSIRISYTRVIDDTSPTTVGAYPNMVYRFEIYGIEKPNNNFNGARLYLD